MQPSNRHPFIFVLGGARSGKSDYAVRLASRLAGAQPVLFVATAQAGDAEMDQRIRRHQADRPSHWQTLEAPLQVGGAVMEYLARPQGPEPAAVLVDCLTLLVSNALFARVDPEQEPEADVEARVDAEMEDLLAARRKIARPLIVVSNEVGLGIIPMVRVTRLYRDLIGRANRRLAAAADHALFLVAGVPLDLKALQRGLADWLVE